VPVSPTFSPALGCDVAQALLPTLGDALGCDVAQALLPAASALMPTLGDDTLSETRTRVETSLDTADTRGWSVRYAR
jgi:glycine cleavage system aminomethyltransferase T